MTALHFEIRVCLSCHLRYPLTEGHAFGVRCPKCLGETEVVLKKEVSGEVKSGGKRVEEGRMKAVLLDNIRSAWNVGSILRSADGFGFNHAYLCGITPTPEVDAVQKTSLGAEEYVTWSYHPNAVQLVKGLKKEGWTILALEEDKRSIALSKVKTMKADRVALVVGNEATGVDPELLDLADHILYIPMRGQKRSFNVANAFSVAAYTLRG
ncbi:MAG: RNA methyltransferase [Chloroflexi bacterium]|nr:RNA methyltransferase [Chloroflexota bacterium]